MSYQNIPEVFDAELKKFPNITGITAAFKPNVYKKEMRLYAPFMVKEGNKTKTIQIENVYDYTLPTSNEADGTNTDWYHRALQQNAPVWMEPYFGKAAQNIIVDYSVPFYLPNQPHTIENQAGVLVLTISLSNLNRYIASILVGNTSYGYLISKEGKILAHPVLDNLGNFVEKISNGDKQKEFVDSKTGKNFWMFELPLKHTNWIIRINLDQEDFLTSPVIRMNHITWTILFGVLALFFLSIVIFRADIGTNKRLWGCSIASAFIFAIGIGLIWHFNLTFMQPVSGTKILDRAALNRYLLFYGDVNKLKKETLIPTGISIQNVFLASQNRLGVSGFIWQKYPKGTTLSSPQGFLLTHQSGLTSIKEMSRITENDTTLVIWHFDTNVRQNMNPFAYPLDKENISLRLTAFDPTNNYVLIPDLAGYEALNSKLLPGIDQSVFLEDWIVTNSFFSYQLFSHNSFYGMDPSLLQAKTPKLYFNITIARNVINPIVSYLIPLFLVVCMLFAVLMSGKTTHIVSYAGAMLIVITFAQVALRNTLAVQGISYLESFYIVIYPMVVTVTITALLRESKFSFSLIEWHNNLITKLLYWPIILGIDFFIALFFIGFHK